MTNYDELVQRLRVWSLDERRGDGMLLVRTSDAITKLRAERDKLSARLRLIEGGVRPPTDDELVRELGAQIVDLRTERDALQADLAAALARVAELEHTNSARVDQAERERDAYRDAMAKRNEPAIALAAMLPPPPIIMPAQDWELHQQIQTLNERIAYLEPIFIAARNLVDNAEEYECDGLGLFAQHGWWEPLHDALDLDGSAAADDIRQPVAPAK
ncbi:MAG: hypothetical protein IPO75_15970 [Betaproteobacteria bacterium]|nr:hypothetical protein [Betaproteobacteria bacterium]